MKEPPKFHFKEMPRMTNLNRKNVYYPSSVRVTVQGVAVRLVRMSTWSRMTGMNASSTSTVWEAVARTWDTQ